MKRLVLGSLLCVLACVQANGASADELVMTPSAEIREQADISVEDDTPEEIGPLEESDTPGETGPSEETDTPEETGPSEETDTPVPSEDGWREEEDGGLRYYRDGVCLTGLNEIDDKLYCFDGEGFLLTDTWCEADGKTYRTDENGVIIKNKRIVVDGKIYYINSSGQCRKGWKKFPEGKSYFKSNGTAATGVFVIKKKKYLFDDEGFLLKNAWGEVNGKRYRADKKGMVICGKIIKVKGKRYYLKKNGVVYTGWKKYNGGRVYYGSNGAGATGFYTIGNRKYYFDSNGIQRTGWRKIKSDYYFFRLAAEKKGYMVTSKKINDVKLKKSGKAKLTASSKEKLDVMVKANSIMDGLATPDTPKLEKLHRGFDYVNRFPYVTRRSFSISGNWEIPYVWDIFNNLGGNCFSKSYAFAYLANAAGYEVYAISSGLHGWAEIDGKIYDPDWVRTTNIDTFFGMSYALSGVGGRSHYTENRRYVKKI